MFKFFVLNKNPHIRAKFGFLCGLICDIVTCWYMGLNISTSWTNTHFERGKNRMKSSTLVASSCALIALAGSAVNAQSINWLSPVDGDWGVAANWAGSNIPSDSNEIAVLGLSGAYTVTSNASRTVGGLMITNPSARLDWGINTYTLWGDVQNNGLLTLNYNLSNFNSVLNFLTEATLSGSGTIRLNANSANDDAQINMGSGALTHASGHTIAGSGRLTGTMLNSGDIIADDPTGQGLMLSATITQSGTGRIGADAGKLILGNGSVTTGGEFFTLNGGEINVQSNIAIIGNINNTGAIAIEGGSDTLGLNSTIQNNGSITINSTLMGFNAHLRFESTASINGTGTITLATPTGDQLDSQIYTNGAFVATIGSGQTISGAGIIDGRLSGTIINNGTVIANDPDFPLVLGGNHAPGAGVYRADGDGVIGLNNASFINGAQFETSGNGSVEVIGSNATVNSIINNGNMGVLGQGYFLLLTGPMTNNGTISINNNANLFNAHLRFDTNTTINGTGTIAMQLGSSDRADAQLYTGPGFTGTITSGQTIIGSGWIDGRDGGNLIINGDVIGTDLTKPLVIDGNIDASGGGVFIGDEGVVALDNGLMLTGGTFESNGAGAVNMTTNGSATLSGVTNNGTMGVLGLGGFINLSGNLTNNGVCLLNPDGSVFNAHIRPVNNVAINGTGTVRLKSVGNLDDAQMLTEDVFALTIGANQTVAGSGRINGGGGGTIINNGVINGDDPIYELRLLGNHSGSGVYRADNGTLGLGGGVTLSGGSFDSSGTGAVTKVDNGIATISNMTNNGQIDIWGNGGFIDLASDFTNNGEVSLNPNATVFNAHLRFTDSFTVNGTGTIRMNTIGNNDDAQIIVNSPETGTIGAGQTIIGDGRLVGNLNVNGTLNPDGPTRSLIADNLNLSGSSQMVMDLSGLSIGMFDRVVLSGGDVMNIDGTLTVNVDSGYLPVFGDTWDIITGGTISGVFATTNMPPAPFGQVYRVIYEPSRVYVVLTCDGDLTGDNVLDFFDVSRFLSFFSGQDVRGDLNNDGVFNFFDVSLFLQLFSTSCD